MILDANQEIEILHPLYEAWLPLDQHEWSQGRKTYSNAIYWVPYLMFDAGNGDSAIST